MAGSLTLQYRHAFSAPKFLRRRACAPGVPGVERRAFGGIGDGGADDEEMMGHGNLYSNNFTQEVYRQRRDRSQQAD